MVSPIKLICKQLIYFNFYRFQKYQNLLIYIQSVSVLSIKFCVYFWFLGFSKLQIKRNDWSVSCVMTSLKNHLRLKCVGKKFQCDVCNKMFHNYSVMVVHKRIYFGERPYKCLDCEIKQRIKLIGNFVKLNLIQ